MDQRDFQRVHDPHNSTYRRLRHPIGIASSRGPGKATFELLLDAQIVPVRRSTTLKFPLHEGGDYTVSVCEGESHVITVKPDSKAKPLKGGKKGNDADDSNSDDDSEEEEEEEPKRQKTMLIGTMLGELTVPEVARAGKIEFQVDVSGELAVEVRARAEKGKQWATLRLEPPTEELGTSMNGNARHEDIEARADGTFSNLAARDEDGRPDES